MYSQILIKAKLLTRVPYNGNIYEAGIYHTDQVTVLLILFQPQPEYITRRYRLIFFYFLFLFLCRCTSKE